MKKLTIGDNGRRGLFSYVYSTFSMIYSCYNNNEEFHIDWSGDVGYLVPTIETNVFNYFFEQPYELKGRLEGHSELGLYLDIDVVPADREKWNFVLNKFLIPKKEIMDEIEQYYNEHFLDKKILCVHKRGTDHYIHVDILDNQYYFDIIDKEINENHYDKIFLATDEINTVTAFKEKYGDKLLCLDNIRVNGSTSIFNSDVDKLKHGKEVIKDFYLLSKGNKLIKTKSTITTLACYINKYLEYINIDDHLKWK